MRSSGFPSGFFSCNPPGHPLAINYTLRRPRLMTHPFPQELWDQDLTAASPTGPDWVRHGLLARGHLTLLTELWKTGKTTLLSLLLSRRKQGGSLAGAMRTGAKGRDLPWVDPS